MATLGSSYYYPLDWLVNNFTEQDEVDWVHGAHSFKFGGGVTRFQCQCSQNLTPGGAYSFGGIQGFLQDLPTLFTGAAPATSAYPGLSYAQRYGRQTNLSVFVEDDWRVLPRLTLNLGIRDDYITNPTEAGAGTLFRITNLDPYTCSNNPACDGGTPEAGVSTGFTHEPHYFNNNPSTRNIDPRVGLAWDIFGNGSTSFRAGFGIFHNLIFPRAYMPGGAFGYPEVTDSITSFGGAEGTFPNALLVTGTSQQARNQTPWNQCCTPYNEEWNATLERQLPWKMLVSVGYVGSAGIHLASEENENSNIPVAGTQFRPLSPAKGATAGCAPGCTQGYGVGGAGYTPNVAFGPLEFGLPHINSNYNSMILIVRRNVGGIQFLSGFTYSRCLDYGSETVSGFDGSNDSQEYMEPNPPRSLNYGPCAFNISKNWTSNALIPLPFHGNQLKQGWQLALIQSVRTGQPVTPSIGGSVDEENLSQYTYLTERPSMNPSFTGPLITKKQTQWFNPAAFEFPAPGTLGNVPRGSITGPGLYDMDFTVMKSTKLPKMGEAASLELRGDFFNVTNHVNFNLPTSAVLQGAVGNPVQNPLAGDISSTADTARQLQFSARVVF